MDNKQIGRLALRFALSPESLAIEDLSYVPQRSVVARRTFSNLVAAAGVSLAPDLQYRTQVGGEGGSVSDRATSIPTATAKRYGTLWVELQRRVRGAGLE